MNAKDLSMYHKKINLYIENKCHHLTLQNKFWLLLNKGVHALRQKGCVYLYSRLNIIGYRYFLDMKPNFEGKMGWFILKSMCHPRIKPASPNSFGNFALLLTFLMWFLAAVGNIGSRYISRPQTICSQLIGQIFYMVWHDIMQWTPGDPFN